MKKLPAAHTHKTPAARLPFPDLPDSTQASESEFWLAAWMRDVSSWEALTEFVNTPPVTAKRRSNLPLSLALTVAQGDARTESRKSLAMLRDAGGLLFAFAESSKFAGATA
jgi:hypothetical protein